MAKRLKIAVIGAGWAGCAAAVRAAGSGHEVIVYEAAREAGGRARRLTMDSVVLDNGQHILIGAYTDTLALLKALGVDESQAFLRLPLQLLKPDGSGLRTSARWASFPRLAVGSAILGARGWTWKDKLSLLGTASRWEFQHFQADPGSSVLEVCKGMTAAVMRDLIEPLCVSALNTPAARASGRVFLRVMHDALFAQAGGSDFLLPKLDLSALLPDVALAAVQRQGGQVRLGARVQGLNAAQPRGWTLQLGTTEETRTFDAVILATHSTEAARLARNHAPAWASSCEALRFEAIATVYVQTDPPQSLSSPIVALPCTTTAPAQFAFDRAQLGGPPGLWALVVSASDGSAADIEAAVVAQVQAQLAFKGRLSVLKTVVEKRATFACEPQTRRPGAEVAPGLIAVGDYIDGPYPATLEGAIRSVRQAWPLLERL